MHSLFLFFPLVFFHFLSLILNFVFFFLFFVSIFIGYSSCIFYFFFYFGNCTTLFKSLIFRILFYLRISTSFRKCSSFLKIIFKTYLIIDISFFFFFYHFLSNFLINSTLWLPFIFLSFVVFQINRLFASYFQNLYFYRTCLFFFYPSINLCWYFRNIHTKYAYFFFSEVLLTSVFV